VVVGVERRSYLFYLFIFSFRMGDKCVLSCPLNYENTSVKTNKGYICTVKQCGHRTPWLNGSCSMEEDFPMEVGGEVNECYLWRINNEMESCMVKGDCPIGFPGVC
jgi:hypothetical protein